MATIKSRFSLFWADSTEPDPVVTQNLGVLNASVFTTHSPTINKAKTMNYIRTGRHFWSVSVSRPENDQNLSNLEEKQNSQEWLSLVSTLFGNNDRKNHLPLSPAARPVGTTCLQCITQATRGCVVCKLLMDTHPAANKNECAQ